MGIKIMIGRWDAKRGYILNSVDPFKDFKEYIKKVEALKNKCKEEYLDENSWAD